MNPIGFLALAMTLAPSIAIVLVLAIRRPRPAEMINLIASVISLASISAILLTAPRSSVMFWNGYVVIDGLGVWTILCAALVYFLASIYAVGYLWASPSAFIASTPCSLGSRSVRWSDR